MSESAQPPQTKKNKKAFLIVIPIVIAIIAGGLIAWTLLSSKSSAKSYSKAVENVQVKLAKKVAPVTVKTPVYVLSFEELKGASTALPLTYPSDNGVVFLSVRTINATNEIWTMKDNKLEGRFVLKGVVVPVYDVRKGEYAVVNGKLLLGVNGTVYEIYGDQATKIAEYGHLGNAKIGMFVKKGKIYLWAVWIDKNINDTTVKCALYDVSNNMKEIESYSFNLGANVTNVAPLPDLLDGSGCLVMWMHLANPTMYYAYKGEGGSAQGKIDLMTMRVATFAPIFLETSPYKAEPFFVLVKLAGKGLSAFQLDLHNVLTNKTITFTLPGLYNFVGIGDYMGNGYVGDLLFLVFNRNGVKMEIFSVTGKYQEIDLGQLRRELAIFKGIESYPTVKALFGLGNYTNTTVTVKTNIGEMKFEIKNVPQKVSSLYLIGNLYGTRLCYAALVNPAVGGLMHQQTLVKGKVYFASGCSG